MFPSALKCLQWSAPHGKSVSVGLIKRVAQQLLASTLAASASLFPLVRKRSSVWQRAVSSPHLNPPPFSLIRVFSFQLPRWLPVVIFPPVLLTVVPPPPSAASLSHSLCAALSAQALFEIDSIRILWGCWGVGVDARSSMGCFSAIAAMKLLCEVTHCWKASLRVGWVIRQANSQEGKCARDFTVAPISQKKSFFFQDLLRSLSTSL